MLGGAGFGLFSAAFVIRGVFALRGHRLAAFQAFRLALLTSVLVTQVFDFALYQFTAVFGLAWDLLAGSPPRSPACGPRKPGWPTPGPPEPYADASLSACSAGPASAAGSA
ncbi:hypothetical protein TR74_01025, partial [Carbonactinospora thermoautotrophica]